MSARYDDGWIASLLDGPVRFGGTSPEQLLRDTGLGAGETVVDYGCGPGFFALPAARIVGASGRVYALDIEPQMVSLVADRAAEIGVDNVTAPSVEGDAAPLPDAVADLAICTLVMHYREDDDGRAALAQDLGRFVKPGGRTLLVQWKPDSEKGPGHGISFEDTSRFMADAGFECGEPRELQPGQYLVVAAKRS